MLKAYKYRIYPNKEQEIQIAKTFGCCRFVYNHNANDNFCHMSNIMANNLHAAFSTTANWA